MNRAIIVGTAKTKRCPAGIGEPAACAQHLALHCFAWYPPGTSGSLSKELRIPLEKPTT